MSAMNREKRSKEIVNNIKEILLKEWDPLCVSEQKHLHDEYDSYTGRIYRRMADGCSREELVHLLANIESEDMGLTPDLEKLRKIADKFLTVDVKVIH